GASCCWARMSSRARSRLRRNSPSASSPPWWADRVSFGCSHAAESRGHGTEQHELQSVPGDGSDPGSAPRVRHHRRAPPSRPRRSGHPSRARDRAAGPERRRQVHLAQRSEEHTSELQSRENLVCRLLLEKKKATSNENANIAAH